VADAPSPRPADLIRTVRAAGTRRRVTLGRRMDPESKQRAAMNEAAFRKVNEGMEVGQDPAGLLTFICECGRLGCTRMIELTRVEYEGVRENPRRFALVPGHEIEDVETVVERNDRYIVVEKKGEAVSEIVEHTDPRS
jgi:hypothetical protein